MGGLVVCIMSRVFIVCRIFLCAEIDIKDN